jgi:hypothetical protein
VPKTDTAPKPARTRTMKPREYVIAQAVSDVGDNGSEVWKPLGGPFKDQAAAKDAIKQQPDGRYMIVAVVWGGEKVTESKPVARLK